MINAYPLATLMERFDANCIVWKLQVPRARTKEEEVIDESMRVALNNTLPNWTRIEWRRLHRI